MDTLAAESLHQVDTALNYLQPMEGRPVSYTFEPPAGTPWRTGNYTPQAVAVRDARPLLGRLSVDVQGFDLLRHESAVVDFYDDREVRRVYYPEVERLVREATGAARVVVFDHNVRNAQKAERGTDAAKEPVKRVHNDFTARSGPQRAAAELAARGEEATTLHGRFAIVNVWRSIRSPVLQSPLAVCDARSIDAKDLVPADLVYRDRVGETYSITHNPRHRWFYFPAMTRDEALLIKCFDSAEDGRARFAAHTAFEDPASPADAPVRESIEVRTLVLFGDEAKTADRNRAA